MMLTKEIRFGSNKVRMTEIDGTEWFAATDICQVLCYKNVTMMCKRIPTDFIIKGDTKQAKVWISGKYLVGYLQVSTRPNAKELLEIITNNVTKSTDDPSFSETHGLSNCSTVEHETFGSVRVIVESGVTLFCANDVTRALCYQNSQDAVARHCKKGVVKRDVLSTGGVQSTNFIKEGDVYRLIAHSQMPKAVEFESWIFDKVVPTLVRTGSYSVNNQQSDMMALLNSMREDIASLKAALLQKNNAPLALPAGSSYKDVLMVEDVAVGVQEAYRALGLNRKDGAKILEGIGAVHIREKNGNMVWYAPQNDRRGLFITEVVSSCFSDFPRLQMKITLAGRQAMKAAKEHLIELPYKPDMYTAGVPDKGGRA